MFKRINNWHLSALIVIVSIFSLVLVQGHVQAQWSGPGGLPGDTPANNLVVNPMLEDLELNDHRITNENLIIDPLGTDKIHVTDGDIRITNGKLCLDGGGCKDTWPVVTGGSSLWSLYDGGSTFDDGIQFANEVGIGGRPHEDFNLTLEGSSSTSLLKLKHGEILNVTGDLHIKTSNDIVMDSNVGIGTDTPNSALEIYSASPDDTNLRLYSPEGDMKIIFQEYTDDPANGSMSIRFNGNNGGYNNWLEFWGRYDTQGPVMTMQREYNSEQGNYLGVGIGVPSGTNINTKLRVQGGPDGEDIFQLYNDASNEVFSVHESGAINIGGGYDHNSFKVSINEGGNSALKLDLGKIWAYNTNFDIESSGNLTLNAHNNVGIGMVAPEYPGYPLHIADNDVTAILNIDDGGTVDEFGVPSYLWTGTRLERDDVEKWFIGMDDIDKGLKFRANDYIDSMVLDSDNSTTTLNLNGDDGAFLNIVATDAYNDNVSNVGISFSRNEWKTDVYTDYAMSIKYGNFSINSYYTAPASAGGTFHSVTPLYIKDIGANSGLNPYAGYVGINNTDPLAQMHVYNDRDGGIAIYGQAASSADGTYAGYFDGHVGVKHTSGGPYNYIQMDHLSAGATPPLTDCDDGSEKGRMIYDYTLHKLYICDDLAWMGVLLKP